MAYSYAKYTTPSASQTDFALTTATGNDIDYLQKAHIHVYLSTDSGVTWVEQARPAVWDFADADTVRFATAPGTSQQVFIRRLTPYGDRYTTFAESALLTAGQLNEGEDFSMYVDQEIADQLDLVDGSVIGEAVKSITGVAPIEVDSSNTQKPVISIDETDSTGDPNALTSDTRVMSEKAIDTHFKQYIGTSPTTGSKLGQIRIDDSGVVPQAFYWNGTSWVQLTLVGPEGPEGPAGPAPGLQDPSATAASVPLNADGSLGTATASVQQDPTTKDLKFLFGIPVGQKGDKGQDGADSTVPGPPPGLQTPSATVTSVPVKGDGTVGDPTASVSQDGSGDLQFAFGIPVGETGAKGEKGEPGDGVNYLGPIDATTAAEPTDPQNGDFYVNTVDGTSSWTGLGAVADGTRVIYNANTSQWDGYTPSYSTDLGYSAAADKGTVTNTNGTDATVPLVTLSNAGLMSPGDKGKLDGVQAGAQVNPDLSNYLEKGDNVSELTNDAGYITAAEVPATGVTSVNGDNGPAVLLGLQEILDQQNTSTTDLWVGDSGETVKLLNTGDVEASVSVKAPAIEGTVSVTAPTVEGTTLVKAPKVEADGDGFSGTQMQLSGGATVGFGTSSAQLGNVMPRDDWSSIPARA